MDYPEIDLQSSDELAIEQGTHVIRLNLVADPDILFALDKLLRATLLRRLQDTARPLIKKTCPPP